LNDKDNERGKGRIWEKGKPNPVVRQEVILKKDASKSIFQIM